MGHHLHLHFRFKSSVDGGPFGSTKSAKTESKTSTSKSDAFSLGGLTIKDNEPRSSRETEGSGEFDYSEDEDQEEEEEDEFEPEEETEGDEEEMMKRERKGMERKKMKKRKRKMKRKRKRKRKRKKKRKQKEVRLLNQLNYQKIKRNPQQHPPRLGLQLQLGHLLSQQQVGLEPLSDRNQEVQGLPAPGQRHLHLEKQARENLNP